MKNEILIIFVILIQISDVSRLGPSSASQLSRSISTKVNIGNLKYRALGLLLFLVE